MPNSKLLSPTSDLSRIRTLFAACQVTAAARRDPNVFIPLCFTDPSANRIHQAKVHRELQRILSSHRKALIELPRDHGKSFQVCCRIVWELGRSPDLRVKMVCATGAIAAERPRGTW